MSVAIIGAGPSGLIGLDAFIREDNFHTIRLFERNSEAGGTWVFSNSTPQPLGDLEALSTRTAVKFDKKNLPDQLPGYTKKVIEKYTDTSMYAELESNVEPTSMSFSEESIPHIQSEMSIAKFGEDTPFRSNAVIKNYVQNLYKNKGYDDHIEFNTSVELAEKIGGKWNITLRRLGKMKDYVWTEQFDFLFVASGFFYVPYVPSIPGLQDFKNKNPFDISLVSHTKQYRSRELFRDKTVIVVGASVSAIDAIHDIIDVSTRVISSIKKTTVFNPLLGTAPFEHKRLERHSQIIKIDPETRTVYFDDSTSIEGVDSIIFGTGYTASFPFLPQLKIPNNRIHHLYQLVSYIPDPTLAFAGGVAGGLTFKVFEWQAVFAARIFLGRAKLPSQEEQFQWEQDRIALKGDSEKYNVIFGAHKDYFEALRIMSGDEGPGRKLPEFEETWFELLLEGQARRARRFVEQKGKSYLSEIIRK